MVTARKCYHCTATCRRLKQLDRSFYRIRSCRATEVQSNTLSKIDRQRVHKFLGERDLCRRRNVQTLLNLTGPQKRKYLVEYGRVVVAER